MPNFSRLKYLILIVASAFLLLLTLGCSLPSSNAKIVTIAEEAYIDLKQGFSLVIPSFFVRNKVPVASPLYHQNRVGWNIVQGGEQLGTLQVATASGLHDFHKQLTPLYFETYTEAKKASIQTDHPAGTAYRWETQENLETIFFLIIEGQKRTYLLTAKVAEQNSEILRSRLEKIFMSFQPL